MTAIDTPYPGFVVSIPRPGNLTPLRRRFFGLQHDLQEYLDQAKRWRDRMHWAIYGRAVPGRAFHDRQSNSSTGIPGVRYVLRKVRSRHDGNRVYEVPVYLAEVWLDPGRDGERPGRSRSKQFSIAKWGADEALRRACEWRHRAVAALRRGDPLPSANETL